MAIELKTPILDTDIDKLSVGDTVSISGYILCGRDAVLPKVLKMIEDGTVNQLGVDLHGQVIFHTAVSPAGVGPTSSNKLEIESSIAPLSAAGIKLHPFLAVSAPTTELIARLTEGFSPMIKIAIKKLLSYLIFFGGYDIITLRKHIIVRGSYQ